MMPKMNTTTPRTNSTDPFGVYFINQFIMMFAYPNPIKIPPANERMLPTYTTQNRAITYVTKLGYDLNT